MGRAANRPGVRAGQGPRPDGRPARDRRRPDRARRPGRVPVVGGAADPRPRRRHPDRGRGGARHPPRPPRGPVHRQGRDVHADDGHPVDRVGQPRAAARRRRARGRLGARSRWGSSSTTWRPARTSGTSAARSPRRPDEPSTCESPSRATIVPDRADDRPIEEGARGVSGRPSVHEGARVGRAPRAASCASASPTSRRTRSATSCTWISPTSGTEVHAGQAFAEVESTKSVSDVFSPVDGTIVERNPLVDERPELVNEQPYGDGWLVLISTRGSRRGRCPDWTPSAYSRVRRGPAPAESTHGRASGGSRVEAPLDHSVDPL